MENNDLLSPKLDLTEFNESVNRLRNQISQVIVGHKNEIELLLTAILANGHVLIEGVPGIAKTLLAKLIAKSINVRYSRIQFTPDLMPSDVLGTTIFNNQKSEFEFNKGPVFSNLILIDEINRSPAKTQSALFEVMEERQITIDGNQYEMQKPFIVFATQNPVEHEGTYRLPEAQLDRFLMKVTLNYPNLEEENQILLNAAKRKSQHELKGIEPILTADEIIKNQSLIHEVVVEEKLMDFIAQITLKTRNSSAFYLGASPRASIAILNSAKAFALINGRDFVTPDDIKSVCVPVLNHRVILTPEKEMEGSSTAFEITNIVNNIEVPR